MREHSGIKPASPSISRAEFLNLLTKVLLWLSGATGLAGIVRFLSFQPNPSPPTLFDLGPLEDISEETLTIVEQAQAVLIPHENGLNALSLVCTHLGCQVEVSKDGFSCPCHGSTFDKDGRVTKGPATQPLPTLHLEVNDQDHLILDTSGG